MPSRSAASSVGIISSSIIISKRTSLVREEVRQQLARHGSERCAGRRVIAAGLLRGVDHPLEDSQHVPRLIARQQDHVFHDVSYPALTGVSSLAPRSRSRSHASIAWGNDGRTECR